MTQPTPPPISGASTPDADHVNDPAPTEPDAVPAPEEEAGPESRFPCPQCAGECRYMPGTTTIRCPYCGLVNEIPADADAAVPELDYRAHLAELANEAPQEEVETIRCEMCAAIMERPEHLDAFECAFCGADVLVAGATSRLIQPQGLLPFHVTSDRAHAAFREWVGSRWLAPGHLRRFATSGGRLQGVYVPFWTYDALTDSTYEGQRGEYYWVTETYTTRENGKTVTKTRQVRKTNWYPAHGRVQNRFDDLLVLASGTLKGTFVDKLDPWDLEHLVPSDNAYLAGFLAERYQLDLPGGFEVAREMMQPPIRQSIAHDIGGDEQRIHDVQTGYHELTFKHILLPVWVSAYRFKGRVYRFLINGRTGEVQGERPYSKWKIFFLVAGGLLAILVFILIMALANG